MAKDIIVVEEVSKLYKLGEINTGSLSHDLNRWWRIMTKKEDPYEKLAESNDRTTKSSSGFVWSLKDVSFDVKEGEVFGIIGKNGAGKSTILKLLSKITKPSRGTIRIDGRVASLLEIGTGFHPDLSGRENVYLNGALLGMKRREIQERFDDIVQFSGIERYIDTPVKRYSSGMFVRLAFAVAAHLEPEILIIDEVLAVGDAEFQSRCLGKMRDISQNKGRTVLFVSHNIAAVKQLCTRAMLLERGTTKIIDSVDKVLEVYQDEHIDQENGIRAKLPDNGEGYFLDWQLLKAHSNALHSCYTRETIILSARFKAFTTIHNCEFHIMLKYGDGEILLHSVSSDFGGHPFTIYPGISVLNFTLDLPVRKGSYELEMGIDCKGKWIDRWPSSTRLVVLENYEGHSREYHRGILNTRTKFELIHNAENQLSPF